MNTRAIVVVLACLVLCRSASAQSDELDKQLSGMATKLAALSKENGKKKITVLDFTDLQGEPSELGKYIAEQLIVELVMLKRDFAVLDRANLRKILAEHKLTASGLVDPENAKKLGMFAGVDALVIGTIISKSEKIALTAKIITTDSAEIVGAVRAEFKSDTNVQHLLSQPDKSNGTTDGDQPQITKPFGDLQVTVESLKVTPNKGYTSARVTLIITNTNPSRTFGVALDSEKNMNLSNKQGEEFYVYEVTGIESASGRDGSFSGSITDVLPRSSITIVANSERRGNERGNGDRPYRLQTSLIFGIQQDGRYPNAKKYNLVMDIK